MEGFPCRYGTLSLITDPCRCRTDCLSLHGIELLDEV